MFNKMLQLDIQYFHPYLFLIDDHPFQSHYFSIHKKKLTKNENKNLTDAEVD